MRVYFDLGDRDIKLSFSADRVGGRFWVQEVSGMAGVPGMRGNMSAKQMADRVWEENEVGNVSLVKDRFNGLKTNNLTDEELKEFMWIKLQCMPI